MRIAHKSFSAFFETSFTLGRKYFSEFIKMSFKIRYPASLLFLISINYTNFLFISRSIIIKRQWKLLKILSSKERSSQFQMTGVYSNSLKSSLIVLRTAGSLAVRLCTPIISWMESSKDSLWLTFALKLRYQEKLRDFQSSLKIFS